MSFSKLYIYLFLSPFVLCSQINGQFIEASQDIKIPFTITQFSTKHGLPQSQVIDIVTKKNGHLIIATANGIVEFDGFEFRPFIQDNYYKKYIYRKIYWHETSNQLFGIELGGNLHQLYPKYKAIDIGIASVINKDSIYCINKNGDIFGASILSLSFKKLIETKLKNTKCLLFDSTFIFIATLDGLYKYDLKKQVSTKLLNEIVVFFKKDHYTKAVYAITEKSIYKITNTTTKVFDIGVSNPMAVCQDIDFIDEGEFFVATTNGLYEVTADYVDCYTKKSALPSHHIQSVYYNKTEDCLFAGTGEKGLLKLQLKNCYSLSSQQGIHESSSLSSIIKTQNGDVIIGETFGKIYKIASDTVTQYTNSKNTYACLAEIDGVVYAGTWGAGVKLIKDQQLIGTITAPLQLQDGFVHCAFKDSRGVIWIGTSNGISKGNTIETIRPFLQDKIKKEIITFYELKNGTLCIGGSNGAFLLNSKNNIVTHIDKKMGLEGKEVRSFYEDKEGKLWIGTYDGGLYCYFKNKLTNINKLKNAMLDRDAFCLAPDNYGYLYMTSNHGLWRVKEQDLSNFYYGKKEYLIPFYYGEETGILNTEFNGGFQNNYLKTKHNHFYFPSLQGIVIVTPEKPVYRKLNPIIDRVFVNDTLYQDSSHVLERNTYSVKFDFSCVSFLSKYNVYYQYKLGNESHSKWSPLQKDKFVNFKLLPAGKYSFSVRAIDAFNDQKPEVIVYHFEIKPHFYETLWFKISGILLVALSITIAVRLRIVSQKRKIEQKELYKRKISEVELNAIQAQLNPHFIFNCMNTIKYFILEKDFTNANIGLNKLSKLIRSSLENSEDMFVPLEQELLFISNYIDIEKMRLQDQMEFKINIANEIDKNSLIPHLLIQPHVENAIKHGIANLVDKVGVLEIEFKQIGNDIVCSVKDNGIGRRASKLLDSMGEFHTSKGTELSKEKSILLNQYYNYKCTIDVIDLYSNDGLSKGTEVIIKMPNNYQKVDTKL